MLANSAIYKGGLCNVKWGSFRAFINPLWLFQCTLWVKVKPHEWMTWLFWSSCLHSLQFFRSGAKSNFCDVTDPNNYWIRSQVSNETSLGARGWEFFKLIQESMLCCQCRHRRSASVLGNLMPLPGGKTWYRITRTVKMTMINYNTLVLNTQSAATGKMQKYLMFLPLLAINLSFLSFTRRKEFKRQLENVHLLLFKFNFSIIFYFPIIWYLVTLSNLLFSAPHSFRAKVSVITGSYPEVTPSIRADWGALQPAARPSLWVRSRDHQRPRPWAREPEAAQMSPWAGDGLSWPQTNHCRPQ